MLLVEFAGPHPAARHARAITAATLLVAVFAQQPLVAGVAGITAKAFVALASSVSMNARVTGPLAAARGGRSTGALILAALTVAACRTLTTV